MPRRGGAAHLAQVEGDEEPALFLAHVGLVSRLGVEGGREGTLALTHSLTTPPPASCTLAVLHIDEPRAHVFLGNGTGDDKLQGWYLGNGATHHMISRA